jgi:hypothetical protein
MPLMDETMRRRLLPIPALLAVAILAGCAVPPGGNCGPRDVTLTNASSLPVEQFYLGSATAGWGEDLLARGQLPSRGSLGLRLPGPGSLGLRAVWTNGRAVELSGVDGCTTTRITVLDSALRAE